ncbi:MAG: AAA family ATPase [Dehalococcoidia bacterium]
MITTLEIKNFKSIKHLALKCSRINILIGKPNAGKSNILEALGVLSYLAYWQSTDLRDFVRYTKTNDLFYDQSLHEVIQIMDDKTDTKIEFTNGRFEAKSFSESGSLLVALSGDYARLMFDKGNDLEPFRQFKFYRFKAADTFGGSETQFLLPPFGTNLVSLLVANPELRSIVRQMFLPFGLILGVRPHENKLEVIKQVDDIIISYPYVQASDTLQRLVFHLAAILSNKNSALIFEEPEAHAFPYYTKYLAETIALDNRENQYFIATHNPYLLQPLLEKSAIGDVSVFITYFENYQTKVRPLTMEEIEEITEVDVFFNIDRFLEAR